MEYLIFLVFKHRHCYHIIKMKNTFSFSFLLFCYAFRFLLENSDRENNMMFYRVSNFIIFLRHAFCFCAYFSRFCEKLVRWKILVGWSVQVLHGIRRLFSSRREIANYGEREEGSRLILSRLHNALWYSLFRSREVKPRVLITFVNNAVTWYGYVFVSYCFCNCYNVYGMRARYTDGDGVRNTKCKR